MPPSPYNQARLAVRKLMGSLEARSAREIHAALLEYVDTIGVRLRGMTNVDSILALSRLQSLITLQAAKVEREIRRDLEKTRALSFTQSLGLWLFGGKQYAALRGFDLGQVSLPPITMMGAFSNLSPAGLWSSLLRTAGTNMAEEANLIVQRAITQGVGPDALARRLRPYVLGSEPFEKAFRRMPTRSGSELTLNLRDIPRNLRRASSRMRYNSERIAFSELHNARAEAEIQHFLRDPLIQATRWRLSPNRGSQREPDECDFLAASDFYGMGAGIYPVGATPAPPHSLDRCERDPVTRETSKALLPKPNPALAADPRDTGVRFPGKKLSPRAETAARESAWQAIRIGSEATTR